MSPYHPEPTCSCYCQQGWGAGIPHQPTYATSLQLIGAALWCWSPRKLCCTSAGTDSRRLASAVLSGKLGWWLCRHPFAVAAFCYRCGYCGLTSRYRCPDMPSVYLTSACSTAAGNTHFGQSQEFFYGSLLHQRIQYHRKSQAAWYYLGLLRSSSCSSGV